MTAEADRSRESDIRAILDGYAVGDPEDVLPLRELLAGLDHSAFGMLLFLATLPAFIPIPVGGAVSGPLVALIGAQLAFGVHRPWLPDFLASRGPHRRSLVAFDRRISPWLVRLERLVRPRLTQLVMHRAAMAFTGMLLVLLGLLLSLPIPLTNYLFAGLLLLFALALIERDGVLMLIVWIAGGMAVAVFGILSGNLAAMIMRWFAALS